MPCRSALTFATAALLLAGCNTPAPTPEAAAPDTGTVDTVAAAGAPIAENDTLTMAPADSVADTNMVDTNVSDTNVAGENVADTTLADTTLNN